MISTNIYFNLFGFMFDEWEFIGSIMIFNWRAKETNKVDLKCRQFCCFPWNSTFYSFIYCFCSYVAIVRPLHRRNSRKKARRLLIIIWILSTMLSAPCFIYSKTESKLYVLNIRYVKLIFRILVQFNRFMLLFVIFECSINLFSTPWQLSFWNFQFDSLSVSFSLLTQSPVCLFISHLCIVLHFFFVEFGLNINILMRFYKLNLTNVCVHLIFIACHCQNDIYYMNAVWNKKGIIMGKQELYVTCCGQMENIQHQQQIMCKFNSFSQ